AARPHAISPTIPNTHAAPSPRPSPMCPPESTQRDRRDRSELRLHEVLDLRRERSRIVRTIGIDRGRELLVREAHRLLSLAAPLALDVRELRADRVLSHPAVEADVIDRARGSLTVRTGVHTDTETATFGELAAEALLVEAAGDLRLAVRIHLL